jgi:hypothetical protein
MKEVTTTIKNIYDEMEIPRDNTLKSRGKLAAVLLLFREMGIIAISNESLDKIWYAESEEDYSEKVKYSFYKVSKKKIDTLTSEGRTFLNRLIVLNHFATEPQNNH